MQRLADQMANVPFGCARSLASYSGLVCGDVLIGARARGPVWVVVRSEHSDWMSKALDSHKQVVSNGWGRNEIKKEIARLTALTDNKHLNAKKKADVTA